jgi:hypothetical protein
MKITKIFSVLFLFLLSFQFSTAQTPVKTEKIRVNGNCGSCKKHIESSALAAGASVADWNKKTKFLVINYDPGVTNSAKIQTAIAAAGYDTQDYKASDSSYFKLDECCQYDRTALQEKKE